MIPPLPAEKEAYIKSRFGEAGEDWLKKLPHLLQHCSTGWDIHFDEPALEEGWPSNVVYPVVRGGKKLMLKTGFPEPELFTELRVLQHWRGREGCVQLIDCDESRGVILMERLIPGDMYRYARRGIDRSRQAPDLFQSVPVPLDAGHDLDFPAYHEWMERAFAAWQPGDDEFAAHIGKAKSLFTGIRSNHDDTCLLHGDLHHENMLMDGERWTAIDPKGVFGPSILEYGRYLHNFVEDETAEGHTREKILVARANSFESAHGVSADDVLKVGFIDLVLASTWTLNDGDPVKKTVYELIDQLSALT